MPLHNEIQAFLYRRHNVSYGDTLKAAILYHLVHLCQEMHATTKMAKWQNIAINLANVATRYSRGIACTLWQGDTL